VGMDTKLQWPGYRISKSLGNGALRFPDNQSLSVSTCTVNRMTYAATALDQNWMHLTL
jgi:hypothetical protein